MMQSVRYIVQIFHHFLLSLWPWPQHAPFPPAVSVNGPVKQHNHINLLTYLILIYCNAMHTQHKVGTANTFPGNLPVYFS